MTERYRPSRIKRDWAARIAAGEKPRDPRQRAIDQIAFEMRRNVAKLEGARTVTLCNHGVPWLDCRVCSKPRSRR